jgi:hypothetical protein
MFSTVKALARTTGHVALDAFCGFAQVVESGKGLAITLQGTEVSIVMHRYQTRFTASTRHFSSSRYDGFRWLFENVQALKIAARNVLW